MDLLVFEGTESLVAITIDYFLDAFDEPLGILESFDQKRKTKTTLNLTDFLFKYFVLSV